MKSVIYIWYRNIILYVYETKTIQDMKTHIWDAPSFALTYTNTLTPSNNASKFLFQRGLK